MALAVLRNVMWKNEGFAPALLPTSYQLNSQRAKYPYWSATALKGRFSYSEWSKAQEDLD